MAWDTETSFLVPTMPWLLLLLLRTSGTRLIHSGRGKRLAPER